MAMIPKMNPEYVIPILTIGKQANPDYSALRIAVVIWGSEDRSGDRNFWWISCHKLGASRCNLKLWCGAIDPEDEDGTQITREVSESAKVLSWPQARELIRSWSETFRLWLPDEILDYAIEIQIRKAVPRLRD
jgi:hypothetical protein